MKDEFEANSKIELERTDEIQIKSNRVLLGLPIIGTLVVLAVLLSIGAYFLTSKLGSQQTRTLDETNLNVTENSEIEPAENKVDPEIKLEGNILYVSNDAVVTQELVIPLNKEVLGTLEPEEAFINAHDINFDGQNDLWVLSDISNDREILTYSFYVYNSETRTFDSLDNVPSLENPQFFPFSRTIVASDINGYPIKTNSYEYIDYFEEYKKIPSYLIANKELILTVGISGSSTHFKSPEYLRTNNVPKPALTFLKIDIPPYTTVTRTSYQDSDESPRIIGWNDEIFGNWTSKNTYSFIEANYLSDSHYRINSIITYDFLEAKFRYGSEAELATLKKQAWFDNRFLPAETSQKDVVPDGLVEKTIDSTSAAGGYLSKPITIRYPDSFPVNESVLNDDFSFVADPGIHNQWLPLVKSPVIIAAAYSGENLFYITTDDHSESKILNLHHVDLISGNDQTIDSATTSYSVFELREIDKVYGYAPEFIYDAMPRVENGYAIYDWLDGNDKVKRLSDNSLVYESTCEKELNGIRRIFSVSESGSYFLTSCPDGLYLGDWSDLRKITFNTMKPIQGMWPHFTSDTEFEFVNRAEADSLGLYFPRYLADIDGNLLELIGSAYGGY